MKKLRIIMRIATGILALMVILGLIIILTSSKSFSNLTFDLIAFSVSATSLSIALLSQFSAHRDRKNFNKIIHELKEINAEAENWKVTDTQLQKKLDELIKTDKQIYRRIIKKKG